MSNTGSVSNDAYKFRFTESFVEMFNTLVVAIDESMDKLHDVEKILDQDNDDYGMCNCAYKLRYITPSNVSTFVSYLEKALRTRVIGCHVNDIEMFAVALVKEFIRENGCVPFEDSSVMGNTRYVNPKTDTLKDLIMLCENDVFDTCVYSRYEMKKRVDCIKDDVKKLEDLHFVANIKNIVNGLPTVLEKCCCCSNIDLTMDRAFKACIEEFILFACTINSISILSIMGYVLPKASYRVKNNAVTDRDVFRDVIEDTADDIADVRKPHIHECITECCLLKTNNMIISSRIPFNCNVRDVVLQDMTTDFRDTSAALDFIIRDSRSPFHALLAKYIPEKELNIRYGPSECETLIAKMFFGKVTSNYKSENDPLDKAGFATNVCWMDTIAYGNNYLDGNYRNDTNGNHHMNPIMNTFDMIYRMFCGCELKSSEDISRNIIKVANTMNAIIIKYPNGGIENWELVRDILSVLGEIMTRNMLKLYNNNTHILSYDDQMIDTMVPGYTYCESFVMEAENDAPSVKVQGGNSQGVLSNIAQNIIGLIQKFSNWVTNQLSQFYTKFNENHKKEVEWVTKNTALNNQIGEAIRSGSFTLTLHNFPQFNIPADELGNINISEIFDRIAPSGDTIDPVAIKKELYPGGDAIAGQIAAMKTEKEEIEALTNYILYKQITPKQGISGSSMTREQWYGLIKDLTETGNLIESQTRKISDDLKRACNTMNRLAREEERKQKEAQQQSNEQGANNEPKTPGRVTQLYNIIQHVSRTYYVTMLNVFRSRFYATNYKLYRDIVTLYQQQNSQANNSNGTNAVQN